MSGPKILFYDIETSPNLGYVWGKWQQNVIKFYKEWEILSIAYKWQGSEAVHCMARPQFKSEKELMVAFRGVLNEADVTIAHNGDEFDAKKIRAKFAQHRLRPATPAKQVDTKKIAKSQFGFTSNSLNDLGAFLGVGTKAKNGGADTWFDCMAGDKEAWKTMIHYNKQDVILLESVYDVLKPWAANHPNLGLISDLPGCPVCLSEKVYRRGYQVLKLTKKPRYQCQICGHWFYNSEKKGKVA